MAIVEDVEKNVKNKNRKKDKVIEVPVTESDDLLREERRSTGRALATGIIIFLVGLGVYHAVVYGSSRLSALVGGFIIMFLYVVSLLYASHRKKKLLRSNEAALEQELKEVIVKASSKSEQHLSEEGNREMTPTNDRPIFIRTYSVA
ncbi:uncharacterized protein LOC130896027 [Diorhabda carinulata]|uniref:uncharacterized protein LOC130896027 n=1 Tax=Diorhabda carinulata TaxID=1163345 RepID=UPI0025A04C7F|nr:uncharacterized protein LOC130896027 [Diorhabda carinulata]